VTGITNGATGLNGRLVQVMEMSITGTGWPVRRR
jgi:hypothetical protein